MCVCVCVKYWIGTDLLMIIQPFRTIVGKYLGYKILCIIR